MISVSVLFFAQIKDMLGVERMEMKISSQTNVQALKQQLTEKYPVLVQIFENVIVAVDHEFASPDLILIDGSEIAFFPPVSGGDNLDTILKISPQEISIDDTIKQIVTESTGGISLFVGIVRRRTDGDENQFLTRELFYEAYETMAYEKMTQIADEIRNRWENIDRIAIIQRIGVIEAGSPSVLVACSASHRDTGIFEAARYGIDRLKEIVPIWKKEIGEDGEIWVEGSYFPKPGE